MLRGKGLLSNPERLFYDEVTSRAWKRKDGQVQTLYNKILVLHEAHDCCSVFITRMGTCTGMQCVESSCLTNYFLILSSLKQLPDRRTRNHSCSGLPRQNAFSLPHSGVRHG